MTEGARVGRRIKELRKKTGLTQEQVANELFISQSYLRQIEQGKANPSVNMAAKITSHLESVLDSAGKEGADEVGAFLELSDSKGSAF